MKKPLTASHGNVDGSLAHLRNNYMEAEKNILKGYFLEIKLEMHFFNIWIMIVICCLMKL